MTPPTAPPSRPPPSRPAPSAAAAPRPAAAVPAFQMLTPAGLGERFIVNGVEGWGKTSLAANAPGAAIIMARGETGYETLLAHGRVPQIPAAKADTWDGLLALLEQIAANPGEIKNLALDALGGFERLCHEFVCNRDFGGNWSDPKHGFVSFAKGPDVSVTDWLGMLNRLDRIREKGVNIWMLSHIQVKNFKNPMGFDYDRYESACDKKTWGVTHKWADAVLFAAFLTITESNKGENRKKGIGRTDRLVYTGRHDAYDAKNRHGMPEQIDIPDDPAEAYRLVASYLTPTPKA